MARSRAFLPPPTCSRCGERPVIGESLIHTGQVWLCSACLTDDVPGEDVMTKIASHSIQADQHKTDSRRARSAGDIESASASDHQAKWHEHAVAALWDNGTREIGATANGEAIPRNPGYLKDTLSDPSLVAIESSYTRGQLLHANGVVALGVDVALTTRAANTAEKLIAHEIALAHKISMEQGNKALHEQDPAIEIKRLHVAARMMNVVQEGVLTLQRLKTGGTQNVVVQHVHVADGGQAVVGAVQVGKRDE